ncbi:hydrogenase formation protein HypD [candidate division KSB3 bacterium]|uniref:Hydrogenase formation protein HypD n=1 Tax=candidate division KSB3 bacterium TaxID=2044937 RepID=A0A9D5Q7N8_9BACT|nr:hydrogenase formation protein HypD [candidate division KSB3 bacterium]
MKYIREYRDKELVSHLTEELQAHSTQPLTFMEVCGGHTMAFYKFGLPALLPENIQLLSGPGCPVCVTATRYLDQAVAYARREDVTLATFGDLMRVPGSRSTLAQERARGADIRTVYSSLDALDIAAETPDRQVIFLGIGFETTAPTSAAAILEAAKRNIDNFFLFSAHKVMPPAMAALIDEGIPINGYLCPGHVSTVTGIAGYTALVERYQVSCVIAGFEPVDILQALLMLVQQQEAGRPAVEIQYTRAVKAEGNLKAQERMHEVFQPRDDWWRGLGVLAESGLGIREQYQQYDAEAKIAVDVEEPIEVAGCLCGEILKGLKIPLDCPLFGSVCTPSDPVGACMVSNEGACATYYKYKRPAVGV